MVSMKSLIQPAIISGKYNYISLPPSKNGVYIMLLKAKIQRFLARIDLRIFVTLSPVTDVC